MNVKLTFESLVPYFRWTAQLSVIILIICIPTSCSLSKLAFTIFTHWLLKWVAWQVWTGCSLYASLSFRPMNQLLTIWLHTKTASSSLIGCLNFRSAHRKIATVERDCLAFFQVLFQPRTGCKYKFAWCKSPRYFNAFLRCRQTDSPSLKNNTSYLFSWKKLICDTVHFNCLFKTKRMMIMILIFFVYFYCYIIIIIIYFKQQQQ